MQSADNFDHLIKKNFSGEIQFKRVKKGTIQMRVFLIFVLEIQLLKELNQEFYKISLQNSALGLKIIVKDLYK
jgi:hypothetical protein